MIEKHDSKEELEGNNGEGNVIKYRKPGSEHEMGPGNNQDYVWWLI